MDPNNEDMRNQAKSRRVLGILIVIGIIAYGFFASGAPGITIGFDPEVPVTYVYMEYSGRDVETERFTVYMKDVISVTCLEEFTFGEMVDGIENNNMRFGIWHNEELGDYKLSTISKIDMFVLIETTEGYVVMNYEGEETTEQLAIAIRDLSEEHKAAAA